MPFKTKKTLLCFLSFQVFQEENSKWDEECIYPQKSPQMSQGISFSTVP